MHFNYYGQLFALIALMLKQLMTAESIAHQRQKRVPILIFPATAPTRVQWIVGIGIPLEDLLYEAMTTGYVFKAEYFLPSTAKELYTKTTVPITVRKIQDTPKFEKFLATDSAVGRNETIVKLIKQSKKVLSSYRWSIYKILEGLANRLEPSGRTCIMKSICEAAEVPFHYKNGMFGELLYILLTPSSSVDELSEHADNEYYQAESLGRSGASCEHVFKACKKSVLEHLTDVHTLTDDMLKRLG